ncbi:hypothetical protein J1N35_034510 [Gossypium stocksii]|uniref:Uncharacterized protein n=1 Tax=Gossypium stocksii TaxID=47602 RepID=A0A9D3US60_9ROSI|nr:hypothetical protein J1N35_034510 [Gossypium stocksii]
MYQLNGAETSMKLPRTSFEASKLEGLGRGHITKAKQIRARLNETIQDFVTKALDAHTTKKENQDSISCFQENQVAEYWSNFAVSGNFKNQVNQDFKS